MGLSHWIYMHKKTTLKSIKSILFSLFFAVSLLIPSVVNVSASTFDEERGHVPVYCLPEEESTDSSNSSEGGSTGDWTQKGTETNKNGQDIFDHLTKKEGFGGAGASGALAVAVRESGLNPKAKNASGGVAGYFQWSGWGNSVNGNRIVAEGSIKSGDESTLTTENELKLVHHELNGSYKKVKQSVGKADNAVEGAKNWSQDYEGVSLSDGQSHIEKITKDANTAYKVYGGAEIKPNDSLLGDNSNTGDENTGKESDTEDPCGIEGGTAEDGTGEHHESYGSTWKNFSDLPDYLKSYAHDPADLLGAQHDGKKWIELGVASVSYDQCVGFSVAYGNALFGAKGNRSGNGVDTASSFAKDLGTKTSDKPKAGAIASQTMGNNPNGHTYVVEHVFANGDILIAEQNYGGASGEADGGEQFSWNFRIVEKKAYESENANFAFPGDNKDYKLNWGK